jgi:hypothetical protein
VPPRPLLVVVGRVEQSDPEVLTRLEFDLLSEQVEDDQKRSLRDLPLLLDHCAHGPNLPGAVLLFAETDALLGRHTKVRGGYDRYANLEINFLLQRGTSDGRDEAEGEGFEPSSDPRARNGFRHGLHIAQPAVH